MPHNLRSRSDMLFLAYSLAAFCIAKQRQLQPIC